MTDPPRLLDDPSAPEELRTLLETAGADGLEPSAVARVQAGLQQAVGPAGFAPAAGMGVGAKLLLALALGGAGTVAAAMALGGEPAPVHEPLPARAEPAVHEEIATVASAPEATEPEPEPAPAAPIGGPTDDPAPRPSAPPPLDPQDDAKLLLAARRALAQSPGQALELTRKHAREFPRSAVGEERDLIRIRALVALKRFDEARRRGKAFLKRHPGSSHSPAVQAALREAEAGQP